MSEAPALREPSRAWRIALYVGALLAVAAAGVKLTGVEDRLGGRGLWSFVLLVAAVLFAVGSWRQTARLRAAGLLKPQEEGRTPPALMIMGVAAPVLLFLGAMVYWWTTGGGAVGGRAVSTGLALVGGVAVIVGLYLLADRYWIRRR